MATLNAGGEIKLHVVAQIVEAEFVIGTVGYVGCISCLALEVVHVVLDTTNFETEEAMDLTHPLRVARGKIIIHRDYVYAAASCESVKVGRQGGDECFALARSHLSDLALM